MSSSGTLLITGATGSLGRRIVPPLASGRACVALYRDPEGWERLRSVAPDLLAGIQCDLSDAQATEDAFRTAKPSSALHLAGAWFGGSLADLDDSTWIRAFDANLHPAFRVLRASLRQLPRGGSVVFVSSVAVGELRPGMAAYVVAKSALETMVRLGAAEGESRGIRVNAVAPDTIGDADGQVRPETILDAVRTLLDDGTINGSIVALRSDGAFGNEAHRRP